MEQEKNYELEEKEGMKEKIIEFMLTYGWAIIIIIVIAIVFLYW